MSPAQSIKKQRHEFGILQQRLRRQVGRAIADYSMIAQGDKVMVCLSGGKDSHTLLDILLQLQSSSKIQFDILVVLMDQGHPGFDAEAVKAYLEALGVAYRIVYQDTYRVVKRIIPEGKTTCSLCSRLRRGLLYRIAEEENIDKIALGHHADDIIETLFLNMFYGGSIKSMPPSLRSDNGKHVLIRPLAYAYEADIANYAQIKSFPIIPCNLCGSIGVSARKQIKSMIADWKRQYPGRVENIFASMSNIAPSQLMDRELFDFKNITLVQKKEKEGVYAEFVRYD